MLSTVFCFFRFLIKLFGKYKSSRVHIRINPLGEGYIDQNADKFPGEDWSPSVSIYFPAPKGSYFCTDGDDNMQNAK